MADQCPTCGSLVEVVTSDEGTSFYRPQTDRLRNAVDLLRRVYEHDMGETAYDDESVLDAIENEIAAFIRRYGCFKDQLRELEL